MKNIFKIAYQNFLELLFPSNYKCMFCGREIDKDSPVPYCEDCKSQMPFNQGNRCKICDSQISDENEVCDHCKDHRKAFDKALSAMVYEGKVKSLVLKFKNDNAKYLAPKMAKIIFNYICDFDIKFDVIIPVPLSTKSMKRRHYNQSALIAHELSKLAGAIETDTALAKCKETQHQKELGFADRQRNLHGAFKVTDKEAIFKKNVLLVDDVITTGATANECCKALKKYCNKVYVVSFARSELKNK